MYGLIPDHNTMMLDPMEEWPPNKMEMKENSENKTWKTSSISDPALTSDAEASSLRRFTIPKIRKTTEEVFLSACCTGTREYSFIQSTLRQGRLNLSHDLHSTWQFGDTKLIRNKDLERKFSTKRSEMRESGRHSRELEEHFCFLAPPQSDVVEIYQHGLSARASSLKILGNPLLGIYIFRHVDVALNYAHSQSITVQSIVIFKVLFGKVKKIQPCVDKNKVSLDPSPNFDCHMSRYIPSLKDTIELQAYNSAIYAYEYDVFSKPVDTPRQCLPYAIVTVKFIGQKLGNGHLMTSLRFSSTGFPKRFEKTCSLGNCTVAKRIGKGKDATVIFEHFRKPLSPFVQENCACKGVDSERNLYNSGLSNENRNLSLLETYSGHTDNNSAEMRAASQVHENSFMPSDNKEMCSSDLLLNLSYLKSILSTISAAPPSHNNPCSSTVITSKFIKDPRLIRREQNMGKQNNIPVLSDISPLEKSIDSLGINLPPLPADFVTSSEVHRDVLTDRFDAPCFQFSREDSQFQTLTMDSKDYDQGTSNKVTTTGQCKEQYKLASPMSMSNVVSEVENQEHSEGKAQCLQDRNNFLFSTKQSREPPNSYESVNTCIKESQAHISEKSQCPNLKAGCEIDHHMSTVSTFQNKRKIDEYIENIGKIRTFVDPEDHSKHERNQNWWKETDNYFTIETKITPVNNCNALYQEYKEVGNLKSLGGSCEKILMTPELQVAKSNIPATKLKDKLGYAALESGCSLTPSVECFSQKDPQCSLESEDTIHTSFATSSKVMELKDQKCVNIVCEAFQEAEGIPGAKGVLIAEVISSSDIDLALDNSDCNITREYMCVQRKDNNEPLSLENIQENCKETPHTENEDGNDVGFYSSKLNINNTDSREQREHTGCSSEAKEEAHTSSPEVNTETIDGSEKHHFHMDNVVERGENKNHNQVEMPSSEESFKFNLLWGEKDTPADSIPAIKQRNVQNAGRSVAYLACTFPEIAGVSDATEQEAGTSKPPLNSDGDDQRSYLKDTCSSESSYLSLTKHRVSDYAVSMDRNQLQYSSHPTLNESPGLGNFELGSEAEIEECDEAFLQQQDAPRSQGEVLDEEFEIYEALKSRIDWEGLFGGSHEEKEPLGSSPKGEKSKQHYSAENNCINSFAQKNQSEFLNPILLPDLQVTIINIPGSGFSLTDEPLTLKDFYKSITESSKPEVNEEKAPGFGIFSKPSGENSSFSCEDKLDNSIQEPRLVGKSELFQSSEFSQNIHENNLSEKPSHESLSENLSAVTVINNESKCSSTKSKTDSHNARNKKDPKPRINKRRLCASPRDQSRPYTNRRQHENSERRRKVSSRDSSEWFSSLSQGRMKTYSQSERHIRSVLDILNSEVSLCQSKRLSKKLDRAVLHLKKAHRRVNTSLQIISNVGKNRKGPLPKAYAIICNNFWESCDLQGSVFKRRYSRRVLSKRKYGNRGEKRLLKFDIDESLAQVSKHRSYRTNREKIAESLPCEILSGTVSQSLTPSHVRESCEEQHPESHLPLIYINQSEDCNRWLAPEHFSENGECMFFPDETLAERESHADAELVTSEYAELEPQAACDSEEGSKENSGEANYVIEESNPVSFCDTKEKESPNTVGCNASCEAPSGMLVSDLDSNVEHFVNAETYKQDQPGCKRNLTVILPTEECTIEVSTPSIPTESILIDPLSLIASKRDTSPQLSTTLVTGNEDSPSGSYVDPHGTLATSTTVPSCHRVLDGEELVNTERCPSGNCFRVDENEIGVREHSELDLTSVTEEGKNCTKALTKLFSGDGSLLLKDNMRDSSIKSVTIKGIHEEKIEKSEHVVEQAVYQKCTSAETLINVEYKSQKEENVEGQFFHLTKKAINSNMIDSHLGIKNATTPEAVTLKSILSSQPSKRQKREGNQVSKNSLCDCISNPAIVINHMPVGHGPGATDNTTLQEEKYCLASNVSSIDTPIDTRELKEKHCLANNVSPVDRRELKEKHCLASPVSPIAELCQILQRADKSSSLQILEKETQVCQNILPSFVEAFERKQECSLEQILISRELLVDQNLWNNCNRKLKPCAIDALVELQMVMETVQFIENKKRYLKGELTFRSLLWYDETLYSELLGRPRGYQMQPNFYPAFQGRLKYGAFCEVQNYHNHVVKCFAEKENSYYAFLKYKRQVNECEAIMKHRPDCFDFRLSVPYTCGVNLGDTLGDLETIRKGVLQLMATYEGSPKVHPLPGKKEHLWIIIEVISSKVDFIKTNEEVSIKIALYGLEHICFDAAKHLVWKEKNYSFLKNSQEKNKKMLVTVSKRAFSRLQKIYDILARDLNSEPISSIELEENVLVASRKSDDPVSIKNSGLPSTLLSHPDICCVSEILDQAKFADLKKLQELTLRCTAHLEVLKKCFQKLQEDDTDDIFVTEEKALNVLSNDQHGAVILKPAAVETYIEVVMLSETVHFLKNSMAKKLDTQRFRGMLWFDLSLLPDLIQCQEEMASILFVDNSMCPLTVIEATISELTKELDTICEYNKGVNCTYALHLISRELKELAELKKLTKNSVCSISTYIDYVPCIASINYGNTVTELEHNYNQFSMLLNNMMSAPQKDLGKMGHIMKVMKTIQHMVLSVKSAKLSTYFIFYQMMYNKKNTSQLKRKEEMNVLVTNPEENSNKPSISTQVPPGSECISKTISNSSKKRPIIVDECEDSGEKENAATISRCKKHKVTMNDVTKINPEKTVFNFPRTVGSCPKDEIKMGSGSSEDLERNCSSPKTVGGGSSLAGSPLPLKNLQDSRTSKSESKLDLADSSPATLGSLTPQQENLNSINKINGNFSAAETNERKDCPAETYHHKWRDGTVPEDHKTPPQKLHESPPGPTQTTCLSDMETRSCHCPVSDASRFLAPAFPSAGSVHPSLEVSRTHLEHQDHKILNLSIAKDTGTNSAGSVCVQDKIPALQVNKTQPMTTEAQGGGHAEDAPSPRTAPLSSSQSSALDGNQASQYFLSKHEKENPRVLSPRADPGWWEPAQPMCAPVYHPGQGFRVTYPSSAWYVYHCTDNNGSTITHQGTTSHEGQTPPGVVAAVASTVQSTQSQLWYSQYFTYLTEQSQVNAFIPGNSYFPYPAPVAYSFQQPSFSQFALHQPLPQAAHPYPPNPGVRPAVSWIYAPWQQGPFPPRH